MKFAMLLFVFVLMGFVNLSLQGPKYRPTPNPRTGCWSGYKKIDTVCDPDLEPGEGDGGVFRGASSNECKSKCGGEGYCGRPKRMCCCR